jgi:hypothetical protein
MSTDDNALALRLMSQDPLRASNWEPLGEAFSGPAFEAAEAAEAPEPPTAIDQLDDLVSTIYDLTVTRAGELKIPVAGSVGGGISRRVVISEYSQSKTIVDSSGVERRYGYAIRFCLTVNKWNGDAKLSLPFLSAQAQLGQIEAGWTMQVLGITGEKIREAMLPPKALSVETFVIAQQSLEKIIAAVKDSTTRFIPGVVIAVSDPNAPRPMLRRGVVEGFALYRLFKGDSINQAIAQLATNEGTDHDTIMGVYGNIGITLPNETPSANSRSSAQALLGGVKVTN